MRCRRTGLRNYYDGVRTKRYVYIEHNRVNPDTGACDRPEYEMYDLKKDPYELDSIAVNPASEPRRRCSHSSRSASHVAPPVLRDRRTRPGRRPAVLRLNAAPRPSDE